MVLTAAAAAAAATGSTGVSLFDYNRKNFMYDRKMRQETEYQIMEFRIKQAELWREDVKDIIGLTSVKMDTYLIVNAVQLGFCVMAFCEGRLAAGTPTWLIGCHMLSLGGAFMYLLMSVWLSMHASITAKAYEVRLLTQHVRLPVPTWAQLEGARTYGSGFEKVDSKQMFRMPFAMGTQESVLQSSGPQDAEEAREAPAEGAAAGGSHVAARRAAAGLKTADVWGLEARGDKLYELDGTLISDPRNMQHLRLVHEALQYWQSYDGFARVAMSMGTNQLVTALAYYVIAYVLVSNHAVVACWLVVLLFMVITASLIRLDMSLTALEYKICVLLVTSGPCLSAVAAQQWLRQTRHSDDLVIILTPIAYVFHAAWLLFLLYICKVTEQKGGAMLPIGFRSVMYIDIFGWIKTIRAPTRRLSTSQLEVESRPPQAAPVPGSGPAVQAVQYDRGRPVPTRPEMLAGALPSAPARIRREDFEPTTFVPRMVDNDEQRLREEEEKRQHAAGSRPGFVPWRIFFYATMLLILLWWVSGVFVLLDGQGVEFLRIVPLMRPHKNSSPLPARTVAMAQSGVPLQGGEAIPTSWPQMRIQPHSLACGNDSGETVVALSQFGLFTAQIGGSVGKVGIHFMEAPFCEGIEGEALRDAALACRGGASDADCVAYVLHRQGQLLSTCRVSAAASAPAHGPGANRQMPCVTSLADEWLAEGDPAVGLPQEEVESMTFFGACKMGQGQCAYAETSDQRIVEVRTGLKVNGTDLDEPDWFPTRVLQAPSPSLGRLEATPGIERKHGALRLLGSQDKPYLGALRGPFADGDAASQQMLEVIDPETGALRGVWLLPLGHQWLSMCSTGSNLYFLAASPAPHLWRFPMPPWLLGAEAPAKHIQDMSPVPRIPEAEPHQTVRASRSKPLGMYHVRLGATDQATAAAG